MQAHRMHSDSENVIEFPLSRRRDFRGCPQCGTCRDTWQIGRLVWGYCDAHTLRWVAADLHGTDPKRFDRRELRRGIEFLATYTEVTR